MIEKFAPGYTECARAGHYWKPNYRFSWRMFSLRAPWRARLWYTCAGCKVSRMGPRIFGRRT